MTWQEGMGAGCCALTVVMRAYGGWSSLQLISGSFGPEAGPFGEAGPVVGADLLGECGTEEEFGVGNGSI